MIMEQCTDNSNFHLLSGQTRSKNLPDYVAHINTGLHDVIVMIRNDDGSKGKLNYFELEVVHLFPYDPGV